MGEILFGPYFFLLEMGTSKLHEKENSMVCEVVCEIA
jgi:hypothetical protein